MSMQMTLAKWMLKRRGQIMGPDFNVETLRENTENFSRWLPVVKNVKFKTESLAGHESELADPGTPREDAIIVHIHGGGFVSGSAKSSRSFTALLAKQANSKVFSLDYRLAPEHTFPAAVNDCFEQYHDLVNQYPERKIVLIGESAGGMLVIAIALIARDRGMKAPACVVANAPGADLTRDVDRPKMNDTDLILSHQAIKKVGELYCPEGAKNPYASPRFADYHDFPPLRIVWDAGEHLSFDCRILAKKARQAGVIVDQKEYQNAFHAFQILGKFLPEAKKDIQMSIAFMEKYL